MAGFTDVAEGLMRERGITLRGLSALVNYDPGGLSKIIKGQRRCPPGLARAIDEVWKPGVT